VNDFCYQAFHNRFIVIFEAHHRRTFLHVRDAAAAIVFSLAKYAEMKEKSFNVGSDGMNYTKIEVAQKIMSHVVAALIKRFVDAARDGKPGVTCSGDGSPVREFMYAGDAAEAIARAIEGAHDPEPTNIGTDIGTSIRELTEMICDLTGYTGRVEWDTSRPNGVARKVLDVGKMVRTLGWKPAMPLREGLRRTIAWFRKNTS
jgi:GDP-L-fucose synthase